MVSSWSYWFLVVSWVIMLGLSIFWCVKYCKLRRQVYNNLNFLNALKEKTSFICGRRRKYNDDGSYTGDKTTLLTDMAIEHFLMVDAQSLIPRREIETPVLIANFPLKTNELEDKK